jgi:hypothetical protein
LTWELAQSNLTHRLVHRAINLIVALTLVVIDGAGLVYFYFVDTARPVMM